MGNAFKCDDCGVLVEGYSYTRDDTATLHHEKSTRVPKSHPEGIVFLFVESIIVHSWLQRCKEGKPVAIELCPKCRTIAVLRAALQMLWDEEIGIAWENGGSLGLLVGGETVRLIPEPKKAAEPQS